MTFPLYSPDEAMFSPADHVSLFLRKTSGIPHLKCSFSLLTKKHPKKPDHTVTLIDKESFSCNVDSSLWFSVVFSQIHRTVHKSERVFFSFTHLSSKVAFVAIAFLVEKYGLSRKDAETFLRRKRDDFKINTFWKSLAKLIPFVKNKVIN